MPYIPHTDTDIEAMLETIGAESIEQLFDEIPAHLLSEGLTQVPAGSSEMEVSRLMAERAAGNTNLRCFLGAGAYEHHIPAAVWDIAARGEFMTAYTPYQAEASQGTLQIIYEYQSMMAHLCAMDVSNASLYDGASALAEAVLMAVRANRKSKSKRILLPKSINPRYRAACEAIVGMQGIEIEEVDFNQDSGCFELEDLTKYQGEDICALVVSFPNFFGCLEDVHEISNWAVENNVLLIGVCNPIAISLLSPPGEWGENGADIVVGEGQPLGVPLASGGPYFGFMCCKQKHVRQMPGRIIGRTVDLDGKEGFALTLQAREQHIRRSKATSNICTNQGWAVTAATMFMSLMGNTGLQSVANSCYQNLALLKQGLSKIEGIKLIYSENNFHELVYRVDVNVTDFLDAMSAKGFLAGYELALDYQDFDKHILVCTTETRTEQDISEYLTAVRESIEELR